MDIPITTASGTIHLIASHPTPPTFDGDEDRNGKRNYDEIRLLDDYLSNQTYLYDDAGKSGGLRPNSRFVVLGDLNSSPNEGDSIKPAIRKLLSNPLIHAECQPSSLGAQQNNNTCSFTQYHTASWGLRVDYVLPSQYGLAISDCGVYWPETSSSEFRLVSSRSASSDHRLIWVDLEVQPQ